MERAKLASEIERAERKLANDGFVSKARPEIVRGTLGEERSLLGALLIA